MMSLGSQLTGLFPKDYGDHETYMGIGTADSK
jgi:hypothetical protein